MIERRDLELAVDGVTCRAWHFVPEVDDDAPCVVMGHGLGATRDAGLTPYAERFAAEGMHAIVFDHRHFGASDGRPRQLLLVERQLEDWRAFLDEARRLPGVDRTRIIAWGTSFGGGHALVAGVRDGSVAAIVTQCPMMDGWAAFKNAIGYAGLGSVLRLVGHGLRDLVGAALGSDAHCLPAAGEPGTLAFMTTEDALPGYTGLADDEPLANRISARTALFVSFYRPVTVAPKIRCPTLLLVCDDDSVAPASAALAVAELGGEHVELHRYPIGHFDIYHGEHRERALSDMVEFLRRHLKMG